MTPQVFHHTVYTLYNMIYDINQASQPKALETACMFFFFLYKRIYWITVQQMPQDALQLGILTNI